MKTGILSFNLDNYKPLMAITGPVKREYCQKHGYEFIEKVGPYANPSWYYAFDRLKYLHDILFDGVDGYDLDVVHVLNASAVVMNFNVKIESFLEDGYDFFITHDCHAINAGSFIVRKSEWLKEWLLFLLSLESQQHEHVWKENQLMITHYKEPKWAERIKVLPQRTFNSYFYDLYNMTNQPGNFEYGDFILHAPGVTLERRIQIFSSDRVQKQIIR
jgi:hypothetical protein